MFNRKYTYRFLESFAYPATLGASLAWWIQALATLLDGSTVKPTLWAVLCGFWFIAYHSVWYSFMISAPKDTDQVPEGYGRLSIATDFLDTAAMMLGFAGLGFASGNYDKAHSDIVFCAVLILVLTAAVANFRRWWRGNRRAINYPVPFLAALAIPIVGLYLRAKVADKLASGLLAGMYLVVACYVCRPDLFSSYRSPRNKTKNE